MSELQRHIQNPLTTKEYWIIIKITKDFRDEERRLEELIREGEGTGVEFKRDEKLTPEKIAITITATANRQGGFILLGVNDRGEICGVKRDKAEEWVMEISRKHVHPSIIVSYYGVLINSLKAGVIKVPLGMDKPYYYKESTQDLLYPCRKHQS